MTHIPERTDAFIVGGGPVGLATAIALRTHGFSVTVADPALPPIDKACGEGLMPDALASLARLGVTLPPEFYFPFRGIRFLGPGTAVDASFPDGLGVGIRRTHLHQALIDRAQEVGATLLWGTPVKGLTETGVAPGVILGSGPVECKWVVGADGEKSRVREWAGLESTRRSSLRFGFRRHYRIAPWADCVEIYWGSGSQIYVTPIGPREICVAVISRDSHLRLEHALPQHPQLFEMLKNTPVTTAERGAVSATRRLARVYRNNVALVGDASGSVDAITGEGLRLGFEQGMMLAKAMEAGDLRLYAAAHRRLARRPAFMAALMLSLDRSAWLRRRVLQALSDDPGIFATQLAMHVGGASNADFIRQSMLPLGRRLLVA
jgi:flavin-dependent dehydrogenase